MLSWSRPILAGLVSGILLAVGVGIAPVVAADSDPPVCNPPAIPVSDGGTGYTCTIPGSGDDDDNGGEGGGDPLCDINKGPNPYADKNPSGNFCMGTKTCVNIDLFAPLALPDGEPPNEDSKARVLMCYATFGGMDIIRTFWTDDDEPSLLEQAMTAVGNIDLGTGTIRISPNTRTLVNLDTWFWMTGRQQVVTGSSAFGLVAIATFRNMTVKTGDGSSKNCGWTTTEAAAKASCFYEYRHSSRNGTESVGGRPAYRVEVTAVYDLTFEIAGRPTAIQGAPTTLDAPAASAALRVDEVQSRVTKVR